MPKKRTNPIPPAKEMSRYVEEGMKHMRIAIIALHSAQVALLNEYWTHDLERDVPKRLRGHGKGTRRISK